MSKYRIDIDDLTIIHTDDNGEDHDLNARGEQCRDLVDLGEWVVDLRDVGAIRNHERDDLLVEVAEAIIEGAQSAAEVEEIVEMFSSRQIAQLRAGMA